MLELLTSEEQCQKFLRAFEKTGQQHIVNYIREKGDIGAEIGNHWPLDEAQMHTLHQRSR